MNKRHFYFFPTVVVIALLNSVCQADPAPYPQDLQQAKSNYINAGRAPDPTSALTTWPKFSDTPLYPDLQTGIPANASTASPNG